MLPKRSDPLTPRVNCFHFVGENTSLFFFSVSLLVIYRQECKYSYTPSVALVSHETLNTQIQRHAASEKQLLLSSFRPQITEPDMTRRSFPSAERVCYLAAGVPWDFCGVHFRRLLRQHRGAFIFGGGETSRWRRSLACWLQCSPENCAQNPQTCPRFKVFTIRWELHALSKHGNVTTLKLPSSKNVFFLVYAQLRVWASRFRLMLRAERIESCFPVYRWRFYLQEADFTWWSYIYDNFMAPISNLKPHSSI